VGRKFLLEWEEHQMDTPIDGSRDQCDDRLVFTVAEAGELLGISRAFAYELVARGDLPVIRLGRRRLVPKVALLALVEANHLNDPPPT
jgi:excisionase family DNA binding protein